MTPQQISDYKRKWMPGVGVRFHSDREREAKDWCKANLETHIWQFKSYTDIYEHTIHFEEERVARAFFRALRIKDFSEFY